MTARARRSVDGQARVSGTEIAGQHGADPRIRLAAAPLKNAANEELLAFIAQRLGIPKRSIRLVTGHARRRTTLEIAAPAPRRRPPLRRRSAHQTLGAPRWPW